VQELGTRLSLRPGDRRLALNDTMPGTRWKAVGEFVGAQRYLAVLIASRGHRDHSL
jgi:hypothetical protein